MARAAFIYLIREFEREMLLAAFTVKHEAIKWAVQNGWGPHNADLLRMRDGLGDDKQAIEISWTADKVR